jgi:hypothetical protein
MLRGTKMSTRIQSFIRFVVGGDAEHHRSLTGIVTEARLLRDDGHLDEYQTSRLEETYTWLSENLPVRLSKSCRRASCAGSKIRLANPFKGCGTSHRYCESAAYPSDCCALRAPAKSSTRTTIKSPSKNGGHFDHSGERTEERTDTFCSTSTGAAASRASAIGNLRQRP